MAAQFCSILLNSAQFLQFFGQEALEAEKWYVLWLRFMAPGLSAKDGCVDGSSGSSIGTTSSGSSLRRHASTLLLLTMSGSGAEYCDHACHLAKAQAHATAGREYLDDVTCAAR